VRVAPSRALADDYALVLATAGIEALLEGDGAGWLVLVQSALAEPDQAALAAYDADIVPPADDAEPPRTAAALILSAVVLGVYALTGPRLAWRPAFRAGSAVAERMVAGEWWRAVTALTLHADEAHLLGNAFIGLIFTTPVCRFLGPGLGPALILATGVIGNVLAAIVRRTASSSVGASTALFGAVGILCGRAAMRAAGRPMPGRRPWMPIGAGIALLALLGTSERADLLAHLTGFLVGLPLGARTARMPRPGPRAQAALAIGSGTLVALSWALALR
jgi:membrane associated rhomboid family serine protease